MDDEILYQTKLHYIIFSWPAGLLFAAWLIFNFLPILMNVAYLMFAMSIVSSLFFFAARKYSVFQIKKQSILIQTGVLTRQSIHLPISKIETVEVKQSILGALLNFGTIILIGTGGTRNYIQNIQNPLSCRRHLEQLIHE